MRRSIDARRIFEKCKKVTRDGAQVTIIYSVTSRTVHLYPDRLLSLAVRKAPGQSK